jgi:hypothetical protein
MANQPDFQPTWALISKPQGYPSIPTPGKIEMIWQANSRNLYHRLSPYTDYDISLANQLIGDVEPFYYIYPDQINNGINALKKYESRLFPAGDAPIDVVRITKFLGSGRGVTFLSKQVLLQTGNAYNETRIYNPTSPLVAAGMGLALGSVRPQRNFDTSAGLAGLFRTLIGSAIPDAILGAPKTNPPSGTVLTALPSTTLTTGGKGLLRAGTANRGLNSLQSAWPQVTKGTSMASGFSSTIGGLVKSLFSNFIPETQSGIVARSDEGAYGLMIGGSNPKFEYVGQSGYQFIFGQQWIAGSTIIRKNNQYPTYPYRMFLDAQGHALLISNSTLSATIPINTLGTVGYTVSLSGNTVNPGYRYGDVMGATKDENFEASDIMVQYSQYIKDSNEYATKRTSQNINARRNIQLLEVLNSLRNASDKLYSVTVPNNARVISSGLTDKNGYDRLFSTTKGQDRSRGISPKNYPQGVLQDYRSVRVVDDSINGSGNSLRLNSAGNFDALNTLVVLPKSTVGNLTDATATDAWKKLNLRGWTAKKWTPYNDDQIAFYFYDVVNENYIPFRAAIKGLNETISATWEDLTFIGRADKIYSYGGFTRNLAMTIDVVISSLAELAPTWQRINYLTTLAKPANYTTAILPLPVGFVGPILPNALNKTVNRFMVPPMVMVTMGDLYKEQPILFQTIEIAIPEDTSWETSNEFNSAQWEYLASYITSPKTLYGQLPRQVTISIAAIILEKERAIVGGANFGSAPRTEDWSTWNTNTIPNGGQPNNLNKSLVVDVTGLTNFNPPVVTATTPSS